MGVDTLNGIDKNHKTTIIVVHNKQKYKNKWIMDKRK